MLFACFNIIKEMGNISVLSVTYRYKLHKGLLWEDKQYGSLIWKKNFLMVGQIFKLKKSPVS